MWKAIVLVLITVELLQGLSYYRDSKGEIEKAPEGEGKKTEKRK